MTISSCQIRCYIFGKCFKGLYNDKLKHPQMLRAKSYYFADTTFSIHAMRPYNKRKHNFCLHLRQFYFADFIKTYNELVIWNPVLKFHGFTIWETLYHLKS